MTRLACTLVMVAMLGFVVPSCGAEPSPASKPRFVVVTHTTGFRHASIPLAEQTLASLATSSGEFDVVFARDADAVTKMLVPSALDGFTGVVFANTTGNLGVADLASFLAWIAEGHAFIGVHSAADTYRDAPEYLDMLGGEFVQHGSPCTVEPRVEDASHPAVAHLAPSFQIFDEIYEFRSNPRPRATILFSLDAHPPDGHPEQNQPGDFPLAWTRMHGRGRVFYTALGHGDETWRDERFQKHLLGAIRAALRP